MDFNKLAANDSSLLDVTLLIAIPHLYVIKDEEGMGAWTVDHIAHHIPLFGANAEYVAHMLPEVKYAMECAKEGEDMVFTLSAALVTLGKRLPDKSTGLSALLESIGQVMMKEYDEVVDSDHPPALKDFHQCAKYHRIELRC